VKTKGNRKKPTPPTKPGGGFLFGVRGGWVVIRFWCVLLYGGGDDVLLGVKNELCV